MIMLALTRRVGETLVIDDNIRLTVVEVVGQKVRLGITAPPEVSVDRQEVHERRHEFDVVPPARLAVTPRRR
jgi:carbon storage regulator